MADLIIPAALRIWLIFLLIFIFLDYSVPFSITFGAIGGIAGGIVSAWWQMKGGAPSSGPKGLPPTDKLKRPNPDGSDVNSRWQLPFLKSNASKNRYLERKKKARSRRLNK
ncbi:MAG: hypothetical protein AAF810_11390 [Cyanobacteria bacterium P01_D01_bin.36]